MADEIAPVQDIAPEPAGSGQTGEPLGSGPTGEPGEKAKAKGEPSGEGLFDGMSPEQLHKSYKSLQGEYTKVNGTLKALDKYGGPDQITQWAEYLATNSEFSKWVSQQQAATLLGIKEEDMDEGTRKAYDAVKRIAESIADTKVRQLMQQEIAPLSTSYKQELLEKNFEKMDKVHGQDWHELRDVMSELSEKLPPESQDRPTFEDLEDLYFKALRREGKLEAYAAKHYQKKLESKKEKSTEKPTASGTASPKAPKTIQEAYEQAKRALNVG